MSGAWQRAPAAARLGEAAATLGLSLPAEALARLLDLCELLAAWATRMNLTGHRGPDAILDRLVLDALALGAALPAAARVADLGAGAGLPGLPLAIARPEASFTLVEARERRHHFQREAVRRLGLPRVVPLLGRAERLPATPHDLVVAQAMGPAAEVAPLLLRWAAPGGYVAIPGSATPPEPGPVAGVEAARIVSYRVPVTGVPRTLWIGRACAGSR